MNFYFSPKVQELSRRLTAFMDEHVLPSEEAFGDLSGPWKKPATA